LHNSEKEQKDTSVMYGYARVSTEDQNLDMQIQALEKAGCHYIFKEKTSGASMHRAQLELLKKSIRAGDTLVVWKLDRLGRNIGELIQLSDVMNSQNIEFKSITEQIDTKSPMGKFMFHLLASLATLERDMTKERTKAGMAAARARGATFGRPSKIVGDKRQAMLADIQDVSIPLKKVAEMHGYKSVTTLNNHFPGVRAKALADAGFNVKGPRPKLLQ